jgi:hypothetical protein
MKLRYIRYGFWLNMFVSFILIFYCIYITESKGGNEKESKKQGSRQRITLLSETLVLLRRIILCPTFKNRRKDLYGDILLPLVEMTNYQKYR